MRDRDAVALGCGAQPGEQGGFEANQNWLHEYLSAMACAFVMNSFMLNFPFIELQTLQHGMQLFIT
jgi:hypothetical protein